MPALTDNRFLQTWPSWSPDGRYLYFCSAPVLWTDFTQSPPDNYDKVKYSLCRIPYNQADNSWGTVTVCSRPVKPGSVFPSRGFRRITGFCSSACTSGVPIPIRRKAANILLFDGSGQQKNPAARYQQRVQRKLAWLVIEWAVDTLFLEAGRRDFYQALFELC